MLKRPHYIALGVVTLITLALHKLPSRAVTNLKLAIAGMFLPVSGLTASLEDLAERSSYAALPRSELVRQLQILQRTNQIWQTRLRQAEEWKRENDRLRDQLGMARQSPWKLKLARVVSRDPANWWRTIKIDRGSRDGVVTNAPVLIAEGLVGRVSEVGFAQAQVVLVGDPDCRVAVLVGNGPTREQGVIAPASSSPLDESLVELGYLSRNATLRVGDAVVTSGIGGVFPKAIPVGQLAETPRTIGYGLYKEAVVRLAVRMNRLEEVWVMMP